MATFRDRAIEQLVRKLELEGNRILRECEAERDYTHRTNNLYDSYGYGIYVGGKLTKAGYLSSSKTATKSRKWYGQDVSGREQITKFLNNEYKPTKGIDMVIVAAMPYAAVLENASGGQKHKYRVISMSYDKLKQLQSEIKGASVVNIFGGKRKGG